LKHKKEPTKNIAQKILAYEVIKDIHGKKEAEKSKLLTNILYDKTNLKNLSLNNFSMLIDSIPTFKNIEGNILDVLIKTKLAISKREGKEFIKNKSIKINGNFVEDENYVLNSYGYNDKFNLIKKGKKQIILIQNNK
jgi:tyrosyl-tRNA synthetase